MQRAEGTGGGPERCEAEGQTAELRANEHRIEVLKRRGKGNKRRYLVRWEGTDAEGEPYPEEWIPH